MTGDRMQRFAVISKCGKYRYALRRRWGDRMNTVLWVMLNPSTADAEQDDPTIRRVFGFSDRFGFGSVCVANLFAFRSYDPAALLGEPKGPGEDRWLNTLATASDVNEIICAWGAGGIVKHLVKERAVEVRAILRRARPDLTLKCLGVTQSNQPKHPLYLPYSCVRIPMPQSCSEA